MTIFEYVVVLVSVVLSLGLAKVLETHANLLHLRGRVKWSITYGLWLLFIVLCHLDLWASLWVLRSAGTWTWQGIGGALAAAVALFYAAVLSSPRIEDREPVDLWAFHLENRRGYLGAVAAYGVVGGYLNAAVLGHQFTTANVTALLPILSVLVVALIFSNRWVQRGAPVLAVLMILFYFSQYLPQFTG